MCGSEMLRTFVKQGGSLITINYKMALKLAIELCGI